MTGTHIPLSLREITDTGEKHLAGRYGVEMKPGALCKFVAPDHYHDAISITLWDEEGEEIEINLGDVCTVIEKHEFENDAREPLYGVLYGGRLIGVDECFLELAY